MATALTLRDLENAVVVIQDAFGHRARFVVERVSGDRAVCNYVFGREREPRIGCAKGDRIEFGVTSGTGWIRCIAEVLAVAKSGALIVQALDIAVVQRRASYREEVVVPFVLRFDFTDLGNRGRTENLSVGGFSGRVEGAPVPPGTEVLVSFNMPEGDTISVICRKVAGDIQQRFRFVDLDHRTEERIGRLVRAAELAKRREKRQRD